MKAISNPFQTKLTPDKKKPIKPRDDEITLQMLQSRVKYMCPFCLHTDYLKAFMIPKKKGWSVRMAQCPECGNKMRMKTLLAEWTPEQFAEWVYNYRLSGFWGKCPFEKFNKRLKDIGWSERFWRRYKELKGELYQDWQYKKLIEESKKGGEWKRIDEI